MQLLLLLCSYPGTEFLHKNLLKSQEASVSLCFLKTVLTQSASLCKITI